MSKLSLTLSALFGGAGLLLSSAVVFAAPACNAWSGAQTYNGGDYALHANKTWRAKWWTQNNQPGADQWGRGKSGRPANAHPAAAIPARPGTGVPPEPTPTVGRHVGSYFAQWSIYGRNYKLRNLVDAGGDKKLTFLNYAFGNVYADGKCGMVTRAENGNGDGGDAWADYQKLWR